MSGEPLPPRAARPWWVSLVIGGTGLQIILALVGALIWATTKGEKADSVAVATVTINARLDRLFDKVDLLATALPVIQEKIAQTENQITEARGSYSNLDTRLRAIENNEAANHIDASRALGKRP